MRVPGNILKTVSFIVEDVSAGADAEIRELWATGFFVSVPATTSKQITHYYFVTARHVAEDLMGRPLGFSVKSKSGGLTHISPWPFLVKETSQRVYKWFSHPDEKNVDVSVVPVMMTEDADIATIPVSSFIHPKDIAEELIGVGDEVFMVGLFEHYACGGENFHTPIVRHGNLAMVPKEDVKYNSGFSAAYLIEARSIGGLSGSPVFIRTTMTITGEDGYGKGESLQGIGDRPYLLGLAHGHWDVKESEMNSSRIVQDSKRGVNMGIAIVVPAHKILEVINQPELLAIRARFEERLQSAAPKMDIP